MTRTEEIRALERHLKNLHHRQSGDGGHNGDGNSWAVCEIPDWEVRQIVDAMQKVLDRLERAEGLIGEVLSLLDTFWARLGMSADEKGGVRERMRKLLKESAQ